MIRITPAAALAACIACTGCAAKLLGDDGDPSADDLGLGSATLAPGGNARVTATSLNLRSGVGTSAAIEASMPCGTTVALLDGPSTTPAAGWWNVSFGSLTGWASGTYLVAEAAFLPSMCGGGTSPDGGTSSDDIFGRAKLAVGYSYYWGHGSWRDDGATPGSCSGSCPSCTHSGQYGADCSGFVAKVWQVPSASPITLDAHPFSTANFYNDQIYWTQIPRSTIQPADALVHRDATSGHIALFDSGSDPFGAIWLYEARGCATGVVHDLRTVDSSYIAIRRN